MYKDPAGGELAYSLNLAAGSENLWRQNLDVIPEGQAEDAYPTTDQTHSIVYYYPDRTPCYSNKRIPSISWENTDYMEGSDQIPSAVVKDGDAPVDAGIVYSYMKRTDDTTPAAEDAGWQEITADSWQEDGSVEGLTALDDGETPAETGIYTLKIDLAETEYFTAASITRKVMISYLQADVQADLADTNQGNSHRLYYGCQNHRSEN